MKVIIPVAGAGTRLRPHTYTQPKALVPLAGKPLLSFIIEPLEEAGITDFIFIIGYLGDKIQDFIKWKYPHLNCTYVTQSSREGIGHAIYLANELIQEQEVFIVLGDTICEYDVRALMNHPGSVLAVKKVEDPRDFGVANINEQEMIELVEEKPRIPKSNMALVGIYKIAEAPLLFATLKKLLDQDRKTNGEYQLTDAIQDMIEEGISFSPFKVDNWFDCGKKETILMANSTLLKKYIPKTPHPAPVNTIIIPPVNIGDDCEVENAVIGPNVSIGHHTVVRHSILKNSIIGSYTHLQDVVLDSSIVGSDAKLHGSIQNLNIGDDTEIDLR